MSDDVSEKSGHICCNCRFYNPVAQLVNDGPFRTGECRYNAPAKAEDGRGSFPTVNARDWCGKWEVSTECRHQWGPALNDGRGEYHLCLSCGGRASRINFVTGKPLDPLGDCQNCGRDHDSMECNTCHEFDN